MIIKTGETRQLIISDGFEIVDWHINWHDGYGNMPALEIVFNRRPTDDYKYEKRGEIYRGENSDGCVQFFSWRGTQDSGYYGRHFPITMLDGSEVVLKGPWSSNSMAVNRLWSAHVKEVYYRVQGDGLSYSGLALPIDTISKLFKESKDKSSGRHIALLRYTRGPWKDFYTFAAVKESELAGAVHYAI